MSEQRDTLETSTGMMRAFENAGIVDEKPEAAEEGSDNETKTGTDTESGNTTSGSEGTDKVEGAVGKDSLGSKTDGDKKPGKEKETKDAGNPGDLKLTDGSVVKAGAERRHYESAQIARQKLGLAETALTTKTTEFDTLKTKYDELSSTIAKVGLEKPEEVSAAVTLYKDLNRDPAGTMKKLLAEMKALGHTFEGIGSEIDNAAITAIIDARLPKTSQEHQALTPEQVNEQASKDVNEFMTKFPDAITHEQHIAALIDRSVENGKPISLQDAYFLLKERVVADGLDWSKPIGPQVEARKTTQQTQQKPRTPGRTAADTTIVDPNNVIQPEKELDTDSIVRAAMQESGLLLNK